MEAATVVIESPVKYDIPYSAGMYGHKNNHETKPKKLIEKILDKISKGA